MPHARIIMEMVVISQPDPQASLVYFESCSVLALACHSRWYRLEAAEVRVRVCGVD